MSYKEIITIVIASYGALLSTYNALRQWREKNPAIKVELDTQILTYDAFGGGLSSGEPVIMLTALNPGHKSVVLAGEGLELPDGRVIYLYQRAGMTTLPAELKPEGVCRIWINTKELAQGLNDMCLVGTIKLHGFYRDQTGRKYKSKKFEFNTHTWL